LLIGKNGSGKTTVGFALEVLQKIARGTNRVSELVKPKDFARGRTDVPMRFEIEVELESKVYGYSVAFGLPNGSRELRVLDERLAVDGKPVCLPQIALHLVALPIIQHSSSDPLFVFTQWLAKMLILWPVPSLISGDSNTETLEPTVQVTNFAAWFSGLLAQVPSAYSKIDQYLKQVMPDLSDIKNPSVGKDYKSLVVEFSTDQGSLNLAFEDLSDGEKCFMICAVVLAANRAYGPLLCFWDEPDNYLAISEVQNFVMALRKSFRSGGQFIATSHNSEAIRAFSSENTLVLYRRNHLEPTIVRKLEGLHVSGDLVGALVRGEVEPDDGP